MAAPVVSGTVDETVSVEAFVDTQPGADAPDTGEGSAERQAGRRRNRRGGRGGRDRSETATDGTVTSEAADAVQGDAPTMTTEGEQAASTDASGTPDSGPRGESGEGRRRGRGRDRQRRERTDEAGVDGVVTAADAPVELADIGAPVAAMHGDEAAQPTGFTEPVAAEPAHLPASRHAVIDPIAGAERAVPAPRHAAIDPIAGAERSAPVAPAAAAQEAPMAAADAAPEQAFELPVDSLQAVAESAGLQWVNSDTDKIRAVHAAMAAEAKPAHVPRERKAAPVVDEGPLVLVETRKDLAQIKLPFETAQGSQPQP